MAQRLDQDSLLFNRCYSLRRLSIPTLFITQASDPLVRPSGYQWGVGSKGFAVPAEHFPCEILEINKNSIWGYPQFLLDKAADLLRQLRATFDGQPDAFEPHKRGRFVAAGKYQGSSGFYGSSAISADVFLIRSRLDA
jgi:hypothetical protein